ncbi:MAG TPA: VacJ family lipoprotein [Candidatus Competibacteraceae bacterium]|nr:VacJ family lipoprotein [Candidatus Competibacteraceae bacterium]
MTQHRLVHRFAVFCFALLAAGCAHTQNLDSGVYDPLESYNRAMFRFNDTVDKAVLKPVAQGYKAITPELVDTGISNFFSNLGDVVVLANDLLQFNFRQAASDASRIVYNTTFGLGGLIDVASHMDLPKHEADFGQTLGRWGVGEGAYLVLPLLGPSTVRDTFGLAGDYAVHPLADYNPESHRYALGGLNVVDQRADLLRLERALGEAIFDPYAQQRDAYLQRRRNLIQGDGPPSILRELEELEQEEPGEDAGRSGR